MDNLAIRVENLGKEYQIAKAKARYQTLRESLVEITTLPFRRVGAALRGQKQRDDLQTFWALQNLNFTVKHGEVVGIIGHNGAGKSTLLKILSRITEPSVGEVDLFGRVGSLLEVGTGFHPELTGRENIYLNGAILGMHRSEIEKKFDAIVDFAGIGDFLDTPAKHYSSGMGLRLGFSVAAHLEPEILVVDEILAVGDAEFQKKSLGKMDSVAKEGRTVLFVSHNLGLIRHLCSRVILLNHGEIVADGGVDEVIHQYTTETVSDTGEKTWEEGFANFGVDEFRMLAVRIRDQFGAVSSVLDTSQDYWVELEYEILKPLPRLRVGIFVSTVADVHLYESYDSDMAENDGKREVGRYLSRSLLPNRILAPGEYIISLNAGMINMKNLAFADHVVSFEVLEAGQLEPHAETRRRGILRPEIRWEIKSI